MQTIQFPKLNQFAINWININEFFVSRLKTKERVDCCYCILLKILEIDSKEQFLINEIFKINKTIIKNSQSYFVLNDKLSKIKINSDNSLVNCLDSIIYTLNFYINGLGTNLCGTINNFHKSFNSSVVDWIKYLMTVYLRKEKQFNIKEHNGTYHEKLLKGIIYTFYDELQEVDKNQAKDIINEYYNIEIDCFDCLIHKTIQREFI